MTSRWKNMWKRLVPAPYRAVMDTCETSIFFEACLLIAAVPALICRGLGLHLPDWMPFASWVAAALFVVVVFVCLEVFGTTKSMIANTHAMFVPRVREVWLTVALVYIALLIPAATCVLWFAGFHLATAFAIVLSIVAFMAWVCHWGAAFLMAVLVGGFVCAAASAAITGSAMTLVDWLSNCNPTTLAGVAVILSSAAMVVWSVRVLRLRCSEYAYRTTEQFDHAVEAPWWDDRNHIAIAVGSSLDRINGYAGSTLWAKSQLYRKGTRRVPTWAPGLGVLLLMLLLLVIEATIGEEDGPNAFGLGLGTSVMLSVLTAANGFRRLRIPYLEMLRPSTRSRYLCEVGLSVLHDMLATWSGIVGATLLLALLWPGCGVALSAFAVATVASLCLSVLIYGLAFYTINLDGIYPFLFLVLPSLQYLQWCQEVVPGGPTRPSNAFAILSAAALIAGIVLTWLAYRKWCVRELA